MEKKVILDVDVDDINDQISFMFGEMIGSLIEYLEQLPNKKLDLRVLIGKSCYNATLRGMLPMITEGVPSYVSEIYLKADKFGEETEVYAKKYNNFSMEYDINERSFQWVLNLCEFIQTYC